MPSWRVGRVVEGVVAEEEVGTGIVIDCALSEGRRDLVWVQILVAILKCRD